MKQGQFPEVIQLGDLNGRNQLCGIWVAAIDGLR